jgi:low temperature requirement protein LtrA
LLFDLVYAFAVTQISHLVIPRTHDRVLSPKRLLTALVLCARESFPNT